MPGNSQRAQGLGFTTQNSSDIPGFLLSVTSPVTDPVSDHGNDRCRSRDTDRPDPFDPTRTSFRCTLSAEGPATTASGPMAHRAGACKACDPTFRRPTAPVRLRQAAATHLFLAATVIFVNKVRGKSTLAWRYRTTSRAGQDGACSGPRRSAKPLPRRSRTRRSAVPVRTRSWRLPRPTGEPQGRSERSAHSRESDAHAIRVRLLASAGWRTTTSVLKSEGIAVDLVKARRPDINRVPTNPRG